MMPTRARKLSAADWQAVARNLGAIAGVEVFVRVVAAHRAGAWEEVARNVGAVAGVEAFDRVVAAHRDNPLPSAVAA